MGEMMLRHFMMMWTTIDPVGNLAIFAALTASLSKVERRKVALRATIYAAIILIVASFLYQKFLALEPKAVK